jgi:putative two-component system response regulator
MFIFKIYKKIMYTSFLVNLSILLVDDDAEQRELLYNYCQNHGATCYYSRNVTEAISLIEYKQFDVALCEIFLKGVGSGFDLLKQIKKIDSDLSILLVTAKKSKYLKERILKENVYALLIKPYDFFSLGFMIYLASISTREKRNNSYKTQNLKSKIRAITEEKDKNFDNTISSLSEALYQRDGYTRYHSEEVGKISEMICNNCAEMSEFASLIATAGKLHDIGKIGIKDKILLKKGELTDEERVVMETHPEKSFNIVRPIDPTRGFISDFVLHHHERWDGSGYPDKLKEEEIPMGSRILAVADTFNAMRSDRPYRKAKGLDYALDEILKGRGTSFDPYIVDIFITLVCNKKLGLK